LTPFRDGRRAGGGSLKRRKTEGRPGRVRAASVVLFGILYRSASPLDPAGKDPGGVELAFGGTVREVPLECGAGSPKNELVVYTIQTFIYTIITFRKNKMHGLTGCVKGVQ